FHAQLEAARARWTKRLEMTDDDWADAAVWAVAGVGDRRGGRIQVDVDKKAWSALGPVEQYAGMIRGSARSETAMLDYAYFADALGTKLTEAGRLGYITHCIDGGSKPVDWAACAPDIAAFDKKKLAAELRADKTARGFEKMVLRLVADDYVHNRLIAHEAEVKKLVA